MPACWYAFLFLNSLLHNAYNRYRVSKHFSGFKSHHSNYSALQFFFRKLDFTTREKKKCFSTLYKRKYLHEARTGNYHTIIILFYILFISFRLLRHTQHTFFFTLRHTKHTCLLYAGCICE